VSEVLEKGHVFERLFELSQVGAEGEPKASRLLGLKNLAESFIKDFVITKSN
jgi:hypothetical protein